MARYFGGFRDRLKKKNRNLSISDKDIEWLKVATSFSWSPAKREYQWLEPEDYLSSFLNSGIPSQDTPADTSAPVPEVYDVDSPIEQFGSESAPLEETSEYAPPFDFNPPVGDDSLHRIQSDIMADLPHIDEYKLEISSALQRRGIHVDADSVQVPEELAFHLNNYHEKGRSTLDSYELRARLQYFKKQVIETYEQLGSPSAGFQPYEDSAQDGFSIEDQGLQGVNGLSNLDEEEKNIVSSLDRLEASLQDENEIEVTSNGESPEGSAGFGEEQGGDSYSASFSNPPSSFADDSWLVLPIDSPPASIDTSFPASLDEPGHQDENGSFDPSPENSRKSVLPGKEPKKRSSLFKSSKQSDSNGTQRKPNSFKESQNDLTENFGPSQDSSNLFLDSPSDLKSDSVPNPNGTGRDTNKDTASLFGRSNELEGSGGQKERKIFENQRKERKEVKLPEILSSKESSEPLEKTEKPSTPPRSEFRTEVKFPGEFLSKAKQDTNKEAGPPISNGFDAPVDTSWAGKDNELNSDPLAEEEMSLSEILLKLRNDSDLGKNNANIEEPPAEQEPPISEPESLDKSAGGENDPDKTLTLSLDADEIFGGPFEAPDEIFSKTPEPKPEPKREPAEPLPYDPLEAFTPISQPVPSNTLPNISEVEQSESLLGEVDNEPPKEIVPPIQIKSIYDLHLQDEPVDRAPVQEDPVSDLPVSEEPEFKISQPEEPEFKISQPEEPEFKISQPEEPEFKISQPEEPEFKISQPEEPEFMISQPEEPEFKIPDQQEQDNRTPIQEEPVSSPASYENTQYESLLPQVDHASGDVEPVSLPQEEVVSAMDNNADVLPVEPESNVPTALDTSDDEVQQETMDQRRARYIEEERKKLYSLIGRLEQNSEEAKPEKDAMPPVEAPAPLEIDSISLDELTDASVMDSETSVDVPEVSVEHSTPLDSISEPSDVQESSVLDLSDEINKALEVDIPETVENDTPAKDRSIQDASIQDESIQDESIQDSSSAQDEAESIGKKTVRAISLMDYIDSAPDEVESPPVGKHEEDDPHITVHSPDEVIDNLQQGDFQDSTQAEPETYQPRIEQVIKPVIEAEPSIKNEDFPPTTRLEIPINEEEEVVMPESQKDDQVQMAEVPIKEESQEQPPQIDAPEQATPEVDDEQVQKTAMEFDQIGLEFENLSSVVECLAFAAEEPIPIKRIARIYSEVQGTKMPKEEEVLAVVEQLNASYEKEGRSFRIKSWGRGIRMATHPQYANYIRALYQDNKPKKLSRTLMETLSIIAYSQPTTKPEVDFVRGVDSDYAVRKLLELGLIDIVGRSEAIGRPLLYGTSERFLDQFGLSEIESLPKLREVEELLGDPAFQKERLHLLALEGLGPDDQKVEDSKDESPQGDSNPPESTPEEPSS